MILGRFSLVLPNVRIVNPGKIVSSKWFSIQFLRSKVESDVCISGRIAVSYEPGDVLASRLVADVFRIVNRMSEKVGAEGSQEVANGFRCFSRLAQMHGLRMKAKSVDNYYKTFGSN